MMSRKHINWSGNSRPPVVIMWMLVIGIICFELPFAVCAVPETITYNCSSDGIYAINGITAKHRILTDDLSKICTILGNKNISCPGFTKVTQLVVIEEDNTVEDFIGGSGMKYFKLICSDKYTAQVNATFTAKMNVSSSESKTVVVPHAIKMNIMNGIGPISQAVNIGDELILQLKGLESGLTISPINCTASANHHKKEVPIWETNEDLKGQNGFCKNANGITEEKWQSGNNLIYLKFYAFRFESDEEITITCSAYVCSKQNDCPQECVLSANPPTSPPNGKRRRRSNTIESGRTVIRQATASFQVIMGYEQNSTPGMFVQSSTLNLIMVSVAWMMKIVM